MNSFKPLPIHWNPFRWNVKPYSPGTLTVGINSLTTCEQLQIITDSLEPFPLVCKAGTFAIGPTAREPLPLEQTVLQPVNSFRSLLIPGNPFRWNVKHYSPGTFTVGRNSLATSEQLQIITDSREPLPLEQIPLQPVNSFRSILIHWNPFRWNVKPYSPGTLTVGINSLAASEQLQTITDSREPLPLE